MDKGMSIQYKSFLDPVAKYEPSSFSNTIVKKRAISIEIPSINYEPVKTSKFQPKITIVPKVPNKQTNLEPDTLLSYLSKNITSNTPKPSNPYKSKINFPKKNTPRYKLIPINYPEITPNLLINGKNSSIYKCTSNKSFYFKMLEFYIKIKIEFTPIYSKIDKEKIGWVTTKEIKSYFLYYYPDSDEIIKCFCRLIFNVCKSKKIRKNWFLGCCGLVRFENSISNARTSLVLTDYGKVQIRFQELQNFFKTFSYRELLDINSIKNLYQGMEIEDIDKCFAFVFTEPVDFSRFLRVFPLFLWLNNYTNEKI